MPRRPAPSSSRRRRSGPGLGRRLLIWTANLLAVLLAPLLLLLVAAGALLLAEAIRRPAGARSFLWFALGIALWFIGAALAPLPVRLYVAGHELTHLLWARLFGRSAALPRVHGRGGSVMVSSTNVWISLAPYFYPFYLGLIVGGWEFGQVWFDLARYRPLALAAAGAAVGLHWTFTLLCLGQRQTDLEPYGRAFALVLITAANLLLLLGLTVWIVPGMNLGDAALALAHVFGEAARLPARFGSPVAAPQPGPAP